MRNTKISKSRFENIIRESINSVLKGDVNISEKLFHFSDIPLSELKAQYKPLKPFLKLKLYFGKCFEHNGDILYEDAGITTPYEETASDIKRMFALDDWQIKKMNGAGGIDLFILIANISDNKDVMVKTAESYGWFLSGEEKLERDGMKYIILSFDPMFQMPADIRKDGNQYAYHWTPAYNYSNILTKGLIPSSKNSLFFYPNRIYFSGNGADKFGILSLGRSLCYNNSDSRNDGDYVLLEIDLNRVPLDIEFFEDPRYANGYFTEKAIPREAIKKVTETNLKEW